MKKAMLLVLPLILLCGCKDPYKACAQAGADIGQSITAGFSTVTNLEQQGLISKTEAANVAGYLEFANKADEAFLTCAQTAHTAGSAAGSFTACAQTFNTTLNNPAELALIKVSNTQASQTITTIINGVNAGISAVETALGGA